MSEYSTHSRRLALTLLASAFGLGTILGPAYNASHYDHFHLEMSKSAFCR